MSLDRRRAADPLVEGECLVISRNQTFNIGGTHIFQSFSSDMAVEEEILPGWLGSRATTGGSTRPTSRIDAAICLNS